MTHTLLKLIGAGVGAVVMAMHAVGATTVTEITNGCMMYDRVAMVYDKEGEAHHIAFTRADGSTGGARVWYVRLDTNGYEISEVGECYRDDSAYTCSRTPVSIAMDPVSRAPCVAYRNTSNHLLFARPTGNGFSNEVVMTFGWNFDLAIAPDGTAAIASHSTGFDNNLHFAVREGDSDWQVRLLSWLDATEVSAEYTAEGDLWIAYTSMGWNSHPSHVYLAEVTKGHHSIDTTEDYTGAPSLATDDMGRPFVTYMNHSQHKLQLANNSDSDDETVIMTVETNVYGAVPSTAIDSNGAVHITYVNRASSARELKLAVLDKGVWHMRTLCTANDLSHSCALALGGADGAATVAFIAEDTLQVIRYCRSFTEMTPAGIEVTDPRPTFRWSSPWSGTNAWYCIGLVRNGRRYYQQWIERADESWTPNFELQGGEYEWSIRAWTVGAGLSEWSDEVRFSIASVLPGTPILVAPQGGIATSRPRFVWQADGHATWYQLWINQNGRPYEKRWISSAETNAALLRRELAPGHYRWWARSWNCEGYSDWSEPISFFYRVSSPIGPTGGVADAGGVTLSWTHAPGAEWYAVRLELNGASNVMKQKWVQAPATEYQIPFSLPSGKFCFWVRVWTAEGLGPWSKPAKFFVAEGKEVTFRHEVR